MKVESYTRIVLSRYVISVRCSRDAGFIHTPGHVTDLEVAIRHCEDKPPQQIAEALFEFSHVLEVKITDWDKQGVIYRK